MGPIHYCLLRSSEYLVVGDKTLVSALLIVFSTFPRWITPGPYFLQYLQWRVTYSASSLVACCLSNSCCWPGSISFTTPYMQWTRHTFFDSLCKQNRHVLNKQSTYVVRKSTMILDSMSRRCCRCTCERGRPKALVFQAGGSCSFSAGGYGVSVIWNIHSSNIVPIPRMPDNWHATVVISVVISLCCIQRKWLECIPLNFPCLQQSWNPFKASWDKETDFLLWWPTSWRSCRWPCYMPSWSIWTWQK